MKHTLPDFKKNQFGYVNIPFSFIGAGNIDDSICDGLIDFYNTDTTFNKVDGKAGGKVQKNIKDSQDMSIPINCANSKIQNYFKALDRCAFEYAKIFPVIGQSDFGISTHFNIQKYSPKGGFFEWHAERQCNDLETVSRLLAFMTYLNDVEDGGETEFFMQDLAVKPKKGLTLIWPGDWSHTHRGVPSNTEEKIIATGWYELKSSAREKNIWLQEIVEKAELAKVA